MLDKNINVFVVSRTPNLYPDPRFSPLLQRNNTMTFIAVPQLFFLYKCQHLQFPRSSVPYPNTQACSYQQYSPCGNTPSAHQEMNE